MSNGSSEDILDKDMVKIIIDAMGDQLAEWRYLIRQILIEEGIIDSEGNLILHLLSKEEAEKRIKNVLDKIIWLLPLYEE